MISKLKQLWNDRSGNALIMVAAAMPLLIGSAGLATDTIQWALWKRQLQRTADSAAIAGVYTRVQDDDEDIVKAGVCADIERNNHTIADLVEDCPDPELLVNAGDLEDQVSVTLQATKSLPFSSYFMATPVIRASATAAAISSAAEYCVVALDTVGVGIEVTGSTDVRMGACSLISNSSNRVNAFSNGTGNTIANGNNSNITALSIAAVGAVQQSTNWNVDEYNPSATAIVDPFASKAIPACNKFPLNNANYVTTGPPAGRTPASAKLDGSVDIDRSLVDGPNDVVCIKHTGTPGLNIAAGSQVILGPATYVIDGGPLSMNSNSAGTELKCNGCTIILTNSTTPANTGSISLTGGVLDLTAPITSPYGLQGIALMQDRLATDSRPSSPANVIQGTSGTNITGAIYIPNQALKFTGGSATASACLQIVAKRTTFTGNSAMQVAASCAGRGMSAIMGGSARRVRLVA